MRVSDSSIYDSMKKQVMRARQDMTVAQEQLSSGLRVQKPSDDPVAAAAARRESSRKALAEAGMKNTELAVSQLESADSALGDMSDALSQARALALSGASETMGDENRRAAADEVRKIRDQMVSIGNTNVAGRYIFGGFRDQQPAFDASGTFLGDDSTRELQAMPGLRVATSVSGGAAFGAGSDDNVFATLDRLASALEANDTEAIRGTLGAIDVNMERVSSTRSQVGSLISGLEMARSVADRHAYRAEVEMVRLTAADEISAATDLVKAKGALEKAIAVAQQIPVGSLVGGK